MNKSDANFRTFIIATIAMGICVFVIVFAVAFNVSDVERVQVNENEIVLDDLSQKKIKGVILKLNLKKGVVDIYDLENDETMTDMKLIGDTRYLGAGKELFSSSEFHIGDVVDVIYTEKSLAISQLALSPGGWTKEKVASFKLDAIENKITVDKKIYKVSEEAVIHYQGESVSSKEIKDNVLINIKGYDNVVWAIEIEEYLGNIRLSYSSLLDGADVEIDSNKLVKIKEVEDIYLTAGIHNLVIRKADIDPIVLSVEVNENDVTEVDLGEVDTKKSLVTFNLNTDDYYVDIKKDDGTVNATYTANLLDSSNVIPIYYDQIELPYGNYEMTFRKKGFNTITRDITISTAKKKLNVTLTSDGTTIRTTISTIPGDAEVYINGKYQGNGKVTAQLYKGANAIKVTKPGYNTVEKTINVEETKEYTFNLVASNIYESTDESSVSKDIYGRD